MNIFAFGDSITWGAWDPEGGWADRLKREIIKLSDEGKIHDEVIFYNLGICGDRTDLLLDRFDGEVGARQIIKPDEHPKFIFAFGANDALFMLDEGKFRVSIESFEKNLEKMIEKVQDLGGYAFFINNSPVDEGKTDNALKPGKSRKNKYVDDYNRILKNVCERESIDLIDVNQEFKKQNYIELLIDDGLHPNTAGHKVIFEAVWQYLKELIPF